MLIFGLFLIIAVADIPVLLPLFLWHVTLTANTPGRQTTISSHPDLSDIQATRHDRAYPAAPQRDAIRPVA